MPFDSNPSPRSGRGLRIAGLVAAVVAVAVAASGLLSRSRDHADLAQWAEDHAKAHVRVVRPQPDDSASSITLPGRLRAYNHAPIHARVNGYIKSLKVDIGSLVSAGDLLAEIDTPDLDQQLLQARADLALARANAELSRTTAERWETMLRTNAVARQAVDEKRADLASRRAMVKSSEAAVERLVATKAFARIVAPFDGAITARYAETGALVNAGVSEGRALFEVSGTRRLRLYVNVPQAHLGGIVDGTEAVLAVPERPDQRYAATVESMSGAVDSASGSSLVQLIIDNDTGELLPGGFATVSLKLRGNASALSVPASALIFDQSGLRVATVGAGDAVSMKTVTILRDLGRTVVIGSGLEPGDRVIENPPDGIDDGAVVDPAEG